MLGAGERRGASAVGLARGRRLHRLPVLQKKVPKGRCTGCTGAACPSHRSARVRRASARQKRVQQLPERSVGRARRSHSQPVTARSQPVTRRAPLLLLAACLLRAVGSPFVVVVGGFGSCCWARRPPSAHQPASAAERLAATPTHAELARLPARSPCLVLSQHIARQPANLMLLLLLAACPRLASPNQPLVRRREWVVRHVCS